MTESELVSEVARRACVSRSDAQAMLEVLADIARDSVRLGKPLPIAEFGATAGDVSGASDDRTTDAGLEDDVPMLDAMCAEFDEMAFVPSRRAVEELIASAEKHPLGIEFLLDGDLGTVAITFQTHAFTVDAARQVLRGETP